MSGHTLLDIGMTLALEQVSAPFIPPRSTVLALIEEPYLIERAHRRSIDMGADMIRASSYAILPEYVGKQRFMLDGQRLASQAGELAWRATQNRSRRIRVAGPLPATTQVSDFASEFAYDSGRALSILVSGLSPYVDVWIADHLASTKDLLDFERALCGDARPRWASFGVHCRCDSCDRPTLHSGETVTDAVITALSAGVTAILLEGRCSQALAYALAEARRVLSRQDANVPLGVLLRGLAHEWKIGKCEIPGSACSPLRLDAIDQWMSQGAMIIGGYEGNAANEQTPSRHKSNERYFR